MSTNFPTSLDSLTNPSPTDLLSDPAPLTHSVQHSNANDAIEAIEAKVGIDSATATSTLEVRAPRIVTSSTRPTGVAGRQIYETDTKRQMVYVDGVETWQPITRQTGFKNALINGDFRINQRTFSSSTTSGAYGFDRWRTVQSGGTVTSSAQTFTPGSPPQTGLEAANYLRVVTSGQSAAGDFAAPGQVIEDVRTFAGAVVTVSFWARAGSGTPKMAIEFGQVFGTGGSPSADVNTYVGQITLSTSWARYSVTGTLPTLSGKTIGTTANTSGVVLNLWASAGSTYASRTGTLGVQNNTFDIWGVQVEEGSVATAFERRPIAQELAMCQRYYWRNSLSVANYGPCQIMPGVVTASTTINRASIMLPVPMRRAITSADIGYSGLVGYDGGGLNSLTLSSYVHNDGTLVNCDASTTGLTTGRPGIVLFANTGTRYIEISTEL